MYTVPMKWLKIGGVIVFAMTITALGIDASDTITGSRNTFLGQLISSQKSSVCPSGMAQVPMATSFKCVDIFEASTGDKCPYKDPSNELESKENAESTSCGAVSKSGVEPWRFITREQASVACVRAGKRLPNSDEWYHSAIGTPDKAELCNIDSQAVKKTGADEKCVSAIGAQDTIGNVWEWTSDDVIGGMYGGRSLPSAGYVTQVDSQGVATLTGDSPSELFYKDYLWTSKEGAFGMMRGGFYGSKLDAGVYAVHAATLPTTVGTAIGFRCVL